MRSTTFDMIGMTLMALLVISTCGVMLFYGYLRETRDPDQRGGQTSVDADADAPRSTPGAIPKSSGPTDPTDPGSGTSPSDPRQPLATHR